MKMTLVKQTPLRATRPVVVEGTPHITQAGFLFYRFERKSPKRYRDDPDYYDVPVDVKRRMALYCNCYDYNRYHLEGHHCKHQKATEVRLQMHRAEDMYSLRLQGYTFPELGRAFGISKQCAYALLWRYEYTNRLEPSLDILKRHELMHLIHKQRRFYASSVRAMRSAWENGTGIVTLAHTYKTDYSTMWKIVHKKVYKEVE